MSDMIDRTSGDNPLAPSWEPAPYTPPTVIFDDQAEAQNTEHESSYVPVPVDYPAISGAGYEESNAGRHAVEQSLYATPVTTVPASEAAYLLAPSASTVTIAETSAGEQIGSAPADAYATMEMPAIAVAAPAAVALISAPPAVDAPAALIPAPAVSPDPKAVPVSAEPDVPRPIGGKTLDDHASFWGSLLGSFGLLWVIYTQLLPFTGRVGFVILWLITFLLMYAASPRWVTQAKWCSTAPLLRPSELER